MNERPCETKMCTRQAAGIYAIAGWENAPQRRLCSICAAAYNQAVDDFQALVMPDLDRMTELLTPKGDSHE